MVKINKGGLTRKGRSFSITKKDFETPVKCPTCRHTVFISNRAYIMGEAKCTYCKSIL